MEDKDESEVESRESEHWGRNWIRVEKNKWFFWNGLFGKQAELREAGQEIYRASQRLEIESFNSGVFKIGYIKYPDADLNQKLKIN